MASIAQQGSKGAASGKREWRVPAIADRWWPLVRAAWFALLALAITVEVVGTARLYDRVMLRPFSHVGLGWKPQDGKATLRPPHTEEGKRSGLKGGETILAVNGVAVGNRVADMIVVDKLLVGPEGSTVVLRTRDAAGNVADHRLTRSEANADELYRGSGISSRQGTIINLASSVVPDLFLLFVAILLMRSRRRDPVGILFSFCFLSIVATGPASEPLTSADWQVMLKGLVSGLGSFAMATALLAFPDGRISGRWRQALFVAIVLTALTIVVTRAQSMAVGMTALVIMILLPAIALFIRSRQVSFSASRQQLRFALFGFGVSLVLLIVSAFFGLSLPEDNSVSPAVTTWLWIGSMVFSGLSIMALAGGLLLSLLRYRLYDVDTVISRSAAYGLMTVGFVAAFAGLENVLEQAAQAYFSENAGKAAGAISAALAAGLIGPMHNRIHAWTEQRFRKGLATMRRDLPNTIDDLRETATFDELAAAVEPRIARGVSADWVRLRPAHLLGAGEIDLRGELEREVATPDGRVLALLEVGPRPDGSAHGKDEREAIDALVEPLARALMVVERREAKEKALDTRIGALEAALATLIRSPRKKPA